MLTGAGLARVVRVLSDAPAGRAALRASADAEDAAVRYAVAAHWRELHPSTALRVLREIERDRSRPLLGDAARTAAALLAADED